MDGCNSSPLQRRGHTCGMCSSGGEVSGGGSSADIPMLEACEQCERLNDVQFEMVRSMTPSQPAAARVGRCARGTRKCHKGSGRVRRAEESCALKALAGAQVSPSSPMPAGMKRSARSLSPEEDEGVVHYKRPCFRPTPSSVLSTWQRSLEAICRRLPGAPLLLAVSLYQRASASFRATAGEPEPVGPEEFRMYSREHVTLAACLWLAIKLQARPRLGP